MGRVRAVMAGACLALIAVTVPAPAAAQPSPTPSPEAEREIEVPEAVPGEPQCTITDGRLSSLSGMVALDDAYAVINDGQRRNDPIYLLNSECQVVDEIYFPGGGSNNPEDLAYDRDNQILWVGDTGDKFETSNQEPRLSVALWRVDLSGGDRTPVIHRLAYPDGPRDAEALILDSDGTPIIVTRGIGTAELFRPAADLVPDNPHEQAVPLERLGEFSPPDTGTDHLSLPSSVARQVITGGANSPTGDRVALRTYTDAFEFDVVDGDVVAAITEGTPRVTPLPNEPLGEAITYSPDGEFFLTVSEVAQETGAEPVILRYAPTEPAPEPPPATEEPAAPAAGARSLLDRLGPQGIINLIGAVGVIGLLMVVAGIIGIVRARRRADDDDEHDEDDDDYYAEDYGGGAVSPGGGPVAARARVEPQPHQGGGQYGAGGPPQGPERPAAPPGTVYSAGGGYPDPGYQQPTEGPFDQDNPYGQYDDPYGGQGYGEPGYGGQGYGEHGPAAQPEQPDQGGTYTGGTYAGGTYQSGQDVPDYYSDDPDYSYEFRERRDW